MKKTLSNIILTILLLCVVPISALAEDVEIDGIKYSLVKKIKEATVIRKDSKYSGAVVIPSIVEYEDIEYSVTSIGSGAFVECSNLTSIDIPNSVTSIGGSAFSRCSGLTSIDIPNSVTSIGSYAFNRCSGLTSITIPNSVTSIESFAFSGCSGLTSVHISDLAAWCNISFGANPLNYAHHLYLNDTEIKDLVIPEGVMNIGDDAFSGCSGLTSVTIPNSVTSIGGSAFYDCSSLTSVNIGNCVTNIGGRAFYGCTSLTSVTIPNSVTSIEFEAFCKCSNLTSIDIPNSVTSIETSAFSGCSSLATVTIPNNVTRIGAGAFSGCSGLTSITIPNSVTSIEWDAFNGCSSLTSVTIGNGILSIESSAFANCSDLESVTILATSVPRSYNDAFANSYIDYATLYVPDESIDAYKSTEPWSNFGTIKGIGGTVVEKEKCATPTIHYADGKLTFECETEGATCYPTVTKPEIVNVSNNEMELGTTYKVSVYAAKPGYEDSDVATAEINMAQGSMGSKFDVNNDSEINITDALIIINFILGRYYNIP